MSIGLITADQILLNALKNIHLSSETVQIDGTVYMGNINLNELIQNAPPDLDSLKELAEKIQETAAFLYVIYNQIGNTVENASLTTLSTSGNVNISGNLSVVENTSLTTLTTSGNVSIGGNLSVVENTSLTTLTTSGNVNLNSNVNIRGNLSVVENTSLTTLSTSGNVNLNSNVSILGNLSVVENTSLTTLTTSGNVNLNSNVSISGNLVVSKFETGVLHSTNGVITSSNVVTSDIIDNSVTYLKMQTLVGSNVLLGGNATGSTIRETKVYTDMIADGAITSIKLAPGAVTQTLTFTEGTNILSNATIANFSLGEGSFYKLTGSIASTISGLDNGTPGRYLVIINNTDKNQTFSQEDENSTASNRFVLGVANKTIGINQAATFIYVTGLTIAGASSQNRWVLISST